jgi:2-(1,2-epoxy-1,2-dihydrophenyl)acetyl-CoA isomerase
MTNQMVRETYECLRVVAEDEGVRVLVLTGEGRGFCPGADLKHFASGEEDERSSIEAFNVPLLLHTMPKVTIAGINGPCAGAGLGWAAACDLRYAAATATFNSAFLNVASAGDMAGPWTLPRLLGAAKARELYFLPEKFFAQDARDMGLVTDVFEFEGFRERLGEIAERLASASPHALKTMKQNFLDAERMELGAYLELESRRHLEVMAHDDAREAFLAFVEKRPPRFGG